MNGVNRPDWYKNWLEKLAQPQPDGSYIVRPFGRIPIVFQVDASTKDRLIKFQLAYKKSIYIALFVWLYAAMQVRSSDRWLLIVTASGILYTLAYYGVAFAILSGGHKVASDRWQGPVPVPRAPRKRLLFLSISFAAVATFLLGWTWFLTARVDAGQVALIAIFGGTAAYLYVLSRRSGRDGE